MGLALLAFLPVVDLSPGTVSSAQVRPQMHRRAKVFVAGPSELDLVDLPRLEADGGGTAVTLQGLGIVEPIPIVAAFAEQPRGQLLAGTRQRAKQAVIRMLLEQLFDAVTIGFELGFHHAKLFRERYCQKDLGIGDGLAPAKRRRTGKEGQAFFVRLWTVQAVNVKELFPASFPRLLQSLGGWKPFHKRPG